LIVAIVAVVAAAAALAAWGWAGQAVPETGAPDGKPALAADRHKAGGVGCEGCHGKEEPAFVPSERCLACHGGTAAALAQKTAAAEPENPHASPHWGGRMGCDVCHRQHEQTVDWCSHCHSFHFQVP